MKFIRALVPTQKMSVTYSEAGVNVDMGEEFVEFIKPLAKKTIRQGSMGGIGGFGGCFDIHSLNYKHPILVSGTDGVGTKLKVAQLSKIHNTVGTFSFILYSFSILSSFSFYCFLFLF